MIYFLNKDGTENVIFDNNTITYNMRSSKQQHILDYKKNLPPLNKEKVGSTRIFNNFEQNKTYLNFEIIPNNFSFLDKKLVPKTLTEGLSEKIHK